MLRSHPHELEADFAQYYHIDLNDLWTGELSVRRAVVLASQLPPESRVVRANQPGNGAWTSTEYLLASILDGVRAGNWQRGGGKGGKPKPVKRPGDKTTKRVGTPKVSQESINAYFDKLYGRD